MSNIHVGRNRIFVGNLPPFVTENEIKEQFGQYGNVISVEIKHRKENAKDDVSSVFAFVSIETDKNQLYECFETIANYNWNGYYVKLELAKESFLERLKREREEAQSKPETNKETVVTPAKLEQKTPSVIIKKKVVETSSSSSDSSESEDEEKTSSVIVKKKVVESSSSSSDSSESEDEKTVPKSKEKTSSVIVKKKVVDSSSSSSDSSESEDEETVPKSKTQNGLILKDNILDEVIDGLVIKNNKNKILTNGKISIESVNSTPIHIITRKKSGLQKVEQKLTPADEKRLNSLYKLKESYDQQKSLIKNALSKIDSSKSKNKIIFDQDGKAQNNNKRKQNFDTQSFNHSKNKVSLFTDNDDDNDINFEIKNQFEGKQGQHLLELQTRYRNDKRFTLDSRFAEEEYNEEEEELIDDNNEQEQQLQILESVIGKKVTRTPQHDNKKNTPKGMLRYDPTNLEHSKFEIKEKPISEELQNSNQNVEKVEEGPVVVSKETFYKVTDNLKQSFKENQEFSLLSMFGRTDIEDKKEPEIQESTQITKLRFENNRNPFRYDSSDSEGEHAKEKTIPDDVKRNKSNFLQRIRGEKLFFQLDDERLQNGLKFLKKFNNNTAENSQKFVETRREIKQIIRQKVRHAQRSNRLFRKKIGQHKHIKIKKAMKN